MTLILAIAFILAALTIGRDRTAQSLITLCGNLIVFFLILLLIYMGLNPIVATLAGCLLITAITLFYQNSVNPKTISAFISIIIVLAIVSVMTTIICYFGNVQGFPIGQYNIRESNGYGPNIPINMMAVQIGTVLTVLIGSAIDTALALSSSVMEVKINNPQISSQSLFSSGMNIGMDILGSTINTLFFIFMAEYFTLFIHFIGYYSFEDAINSKELTQELVIIAMAAVASILVIPVTSYVSGKIYSSRPILSEES